MALAAAADELAMRVVGGTRPTAFTARDRQPLLNQVRAREVIREIRNGEDERSVVKAKHETSVGSRRQQPDARRTLQDPQHAANPRDFASLRGYALRVPEYRIERMLSSAVTVGN